MATESTSGTNPASPGSAGGGQAQAAPAIERMFTPRDEGDGPRQEPSERRARQREAPEDRTPSTDEGLDDGSDDEIHDETGSKGAKPKEKDAEDDEDEADDEEDSEAESDDDEGDDEDPEIEVKVGDKAEKVKLSVLAESLSKARDYTKKTQEIAADREVLYQYATDAKAERERVIEFAQEANALIEALMPDQKEWDALKAANPGEYVKQKDALDVILKKRGELVAGVRDALTAQQNEEARNRDLFVKAETDKVRETFPALFDPKKGPQIKTRIINYGKSLGYTEAEIRGAVDHREILTLYRAMRFMEISEQRGKIGKREKEARPEPKQVPSVRTAQPVRRPVRDARTDVGKAAARLKSSGSVNDAAEVFTSMLTSPRR